MQRSICRLTALVLGVLALGACSEINAAEKQRNVVLIVADDLGLQAGCYGDRVARTPGIDGLAAEGTRFSRAYCTTASCSASRSVLLTGKYNHATGMYGLAHGYHHFSAFDRVRSLPVMLSEAGYRTCSVGKFHVTPDSAFRFDEFHNEGTQGNRNPVRMARNAREWIQQQDDRPFFLYFCTSDPHRAGTRDPFANKRDNPQAYPGVTSTAFDPQQMVVPPWLPDTPASRRDLAEFYESIARMDQGVGALVDCLKETGHWDDTLVIFLSDNGPPFPGAKTTLFEPGVNLPLIIRNPDQRKHGVVCDARVTWADITPTILDFCNAAPQHRDAGAAFHGRSFLPALEQEHPDGWDELFLSHTFHEVTMYYPMRAVIGGRYKYIVNFANELPFPFASDLYASATWQDALVRNDRLYGKRETSAYLNRPRHELYDLENDPDEIHNLADDPQHKKTLDDLQSRLRAWQERTGDPWVLKWERE